MNKEIKNQIINNLYKYSKKYYSSKIKLDESILEEIFSDKQAIYGLSERNTYILRLFLGVTNNGKSVKNENLKSNVKMNNNQRIYQILKKSIKRIYELDTQIKAKKIKDNKEGFINQEIDFLQLDIKTTIFLKEEGCIKIKHLLLIDEQDLKIKCNIKNIDYKEIIKKLDTFELKFYSKNHNPFQPIEELNISSQTRQILRKKEIFVYGELIKQTEQLIADKYIKKSVKDEIKKIYEEDTSNKITVTETLQTEQISILLSELIDQKKQLDKQTENLKETQETLETTIEKYLEIIRLSHKEADKNVYKLLQETLQAQNRIIESINDNQNKIDIITSQIDIIINSTTEYKIKNKKF